MEVTIPEHVLVLDGGKDKDGTPKKDPWSYARCVRWVVDTNHQLFNADGQGIRAGQRILDVVNGKEPGDKIAYADDDADRLHRAFENPEQGYCPTLFDGDGNAVPVQNRIFLPYMNTVAADE